MTGSFAASPFGSAPISIAALSLASRLSRRREAARAGDADTQGRGGNDSASADKWKLMTALSAARPLLGLSDRTLAVLTALVSVLPGRELKADEEQIVFPSNAELSRRTQGMADATLRRHIASLVQSGLISRRDSPNGKRYARRGDGGAIETAFGFDLGPLALRSAEIFAMEDEVKADQARARRLRDEISVHIRDIAKILDAASTEGRAGQTDWQALGMRLLPLARRMARTATPEALMHRRDDLLALRTVCETAWLDGLSEDDLDAAFDDENSNMSANDRHFERHIQNSNTESPIEQASRKEMKQSPQGAPEVKGGAEEGQAARRGGTLPDGREAQAGQLPPLAAVKSACRSINDYAREGISGWADLKTAADLVRPMLGISPDAWTKAKSAFGPDRAAVVLACILERTDAIRSPGGYLRALTLKAEDGKFSLTPMLEALMKGS